MKIIPNPLSDLGLQYVDDSSINSLTSDTIYFISNAGNDSTGDGTALLPFATVNHALSLLPKNLGGFTAQLNILDGLLVSSIVEASGFYNGLLYFHTDSASTFTSDNVAKIIYIHDCSCNVQIANFTYIITDNNQKAIDIYNINGNVILGSLAFGCSGSFTGTTNVTVNNVATISVNQLENSADTTSEIGFYLNTVTAYGIDTIISNNNFGNTTVDPSSNYISMSIANGFLYSPYTNPTENYQYANKKYVDDSSGSGNIDGGTANSIYLISQSIDGGTA